MQKLWTDRGWDDYIYWQDHDKKTAKKINSLLRDIERSPFTGIGKPEPLKDNWSGWWSRRIDDINRIVYRIKKESLEIAQCRNHYE